MNLTQWAIKWGVPLEAVQDLQREFGLVSTNPAANDADPSSETAVQTLIRLEASAMGARLWRNNVGAFDARYPPSPGSRWGLANDTKAMNHSIKSSDLIGLRPVTILPGHVGMRFGQFVAREVKAADWRYAGTEREQAQLKFLELVASLGGDAAFANSGGTL